MSLGRTSTGIASLTRWWRVLAYAGIFLAASVLRAADDDKVIFPAGGTKSEAPAPTTASVANSLTLVLGVALAGVGGWFVWRNRQRTPGTPNLRALAISETKSLGNRQYLVVASYEGKRFLLGVCPGQINMLTSLDAAAAQAKSLE